MKKSRFSDEQIVRILREADQGTVAEVAKKNGVSEQTIVSDQINTPLAPLSDCAAGEIGSRRLKLRL